MKIHAPFVITSRLLPGLHIRNGKDLVELSIQFDGETRDGRARYRYYIDGAGLEHSGNDLKSGVGGGFLASGMASLLSFLTAAAESYRYRRMDWEKITEDDNASLFPKDVVEWAYANKYELTMLEMEIEESKTDLIEE